MRETGREAPGEAADSFPVFRNGTPKNNFQPFFMLLVQ